MMFFRAAPHSHPICACSNKIQAIIIETDSGSDPRKTRSLRGMSIRFRVPLPLAALLGGILLPAVAHASTITASANGTFVTAEDAGPSFLIATRPVADAWEQFHVVANADGTSSLQASINGLFVTVYPG